MSGFVVVIDLDKTVFPTWKFIDDLARELEVGFGVDSNWFRRHVPNAHTPGVDDLRYYDFFRQLRKLGLDGDQVEAYILERMRERDYVFEDVPKFLKFLLHNVKPQETILLTYGEQRFQKLKFECAPSLNSLTFVATLEPKRNYFNKNLKNSTGLVIDDKMINGLPGSFRQFKLDRDVRSSDSLSGSFFDLEERWNEIFK